MPVTAVQKLTEGTSTGATSFVTSSWTPTNNKLYILAVHTRRSSASPTDSMTASGNGLTWTKFATIADSTGSSGDRITLFRSLGSGGTAGAITITAGEAQLRAGWSLTEFDNIDKTGVNGANAIVQTANNVINSGAATGITVTLGAFGSVNNATYGAVGLTNTNLNITVGSGFTELGAAQEGSAVSKIESEWKTTNDTTVDWTWTDSGDTNAVALAVELKFVAAGTAYTQTISESQATSTEVITKSTTRSISDTSTFVGNEVITKAITRIISESQAVSTEVLTHVFTNILAISEAINTSTEVIVKAITRIISETFTVVGNEVIKKLTTRTISESQAIHTEVITRSFSELINDTIKTSEWILYLKNGISVLWTKIGRPTTVWTKIGQTVTSWKKIGKPDG